jgi:hypothetical protein
MNKLAIFSKAASRSACRHSPNLLVSRLCPLICYLGVVSFVAEFNSLPLESLVKRSQSAGVQAVRESMAKSELSFADFAHLISPAAAELLEHMGRRSHAMTQQRFGKVIRLFAPLYLSNECVNNCQYCGFSRDNPILRVTLSLEEVKREAQALKEQGFRNILLVAGEHPKFISNSYLKDCIAALHADWPGISLEIGPMETADYRPLVETGADGLVVYQETYDRKIYADMHTAGPKRNFDWRLETPERGYAAGFRRLGISPLYGLADWRFAAELLEGAVDDFAAAAASVRGRIPAAHAHDRPRPGATRLRVSADVSRCRSCAFDARTGEAARRADSAGHHDDERGQPHRTGGLHRRGQGKDSSHRARTDCGTRVRRQRMGAANFGGASVLASRLVRSLAPPKLRNERDRTISNCRRTFRQRSGGIDPPAGVRTGVEGLGRGVDGVKIHHAVRQLHRFILL